MIPNYIKTDEYYPKARTKAPTLIRFQTKTELFCSGYGYRPHYNAENDHRKRSHSKTLSRVERFENDDFWKRCFLVWTVKTMLSENGDVIHRLDRALAHSTVSIQNGEQTVPCGFSLDDRCSVDGRKRYENDKCGRKSFWKRSKTAPFSFENGVVWTGLKSKN